MAVRFTNSSVVALIAASDNLVSAPIFNEGRRMDVPMNVSPRSGWRPRVGLMKLARDDLEHRGVMAGDPQKYKDVPDRILKPQFLPDMENQADRDEHAAGQQ